MSEGSIVDEFEGEAMKAFIEAMMPKFKKMAVPMMKKLQEFLGDGERSLYVTNKDGNMYLMVITMSGIIEMDLAEGSFSVFPVNEFMDIMMTGELDDLIKKIEEANKTVESA